MKRVIWKRVLFWSLPVLMIGWECILRLVWRLFDGTGTTALELPNWWLFSEASEILLNYFWIAFIWAFKRYAKIIAVIVFVWFCVERWLLLTSSVFVEKGLGGWEVTMAVLFMAIKVAPLLVDGRTGSVPALLSIFRAGAAPTSRPRRASRRASARPSSPARCWPASGRPRWRRCRPRGAVRCGS